MDKIKTKNIVKHLRELASYETDPGTTECGICMEIYTKYVSIDDREEYYFEGYTECMRIIGEHPDHSGIKAFPIKHPYLDPLKGYCAAENLWDIETEYGRTRREWCGYIADKLEKKHVKKIKK
ncbi:MAG: hypothetical protein GY810_32380 [Aureispira sp.]|nr:hypothetical protein [Aureispira sp.]